MLARPFNFRYNDSFHQPPTPGRRGRTVKRSRVILVYGMDAAEVTYQVIQVTPPAAVTSRPARVSARVFREFFEAALASQAEHIKEQINA